MYSLYYFVMLINFDIFTNFYILKWKNCANAVEYFLLFFFHVSDVFLLPPVALSYINFHETGLSSNANSSYLK